MDMSTSGFTTKEGVGASTHLASRLYLSTLWNVILGSSVKLDAHIATIDAALSLVDLHSNRGSESESAMRHMLRLGSAVSTATGNFVEVTLRGLAYFLKKTPVARPALHAMLEEAANELGTQLSLFQAASGHGVSTQMDLGEYITVFGATRGIADIVALVDWNDSLHDRRKNTPGYMLPELTGELVEHMRKAMLAYIAILVLESEGSVPLKSLILFRIAAMRPRATLIKGAIHVEYTLRVLY